MKLIHLNATNDSLAGIGLSSNTKAELDFSDIFLP